MKRRRVKITGIGPVTPAGIGKDAFWRGILEPVSRVRPYHALGAEYGEFIAGCVPNFSAYEYFRDREAIPKGCSRQSLFALVAAKLALDDAGVSAAELGQANLVIYSGSSIMDFGGVIGSVDSVAKKGHAGAHVRAIYSTGISGVASAINYALGTSARSMSVSNQCDSGLDAIGMASQLIANGEADMALCGGTEAPLHRFPMLELRAAELTPWTTEMSSQQARPFDLWRTTGVVSEGACMFVLEPEESPRPGYAYISGYAFANDTRGVLCNGLAEAGRLAIAAARRKPEDVDVVCAWGPGHRLIDRAEAEALAELLGERLHGVAVSSIKGAVGIALGASAAMQVAVCGLGLQHGIVPPTVNWQHPDPSCPLNLSRRARYLDHHVALVNAHGLGGVNSAMVMEKSR